MSGEPQYVMTVRVSDMRVPVVPSKRVRCSECSAWLWLSMTVSAVIPPDTKPICESCVDSKEAATGLAPRLEIPAGVRAEFLKFIQNSGRYDEAN